MAREKTFDFKRIARTPRTAKLPKATPKASVRTAKPKQPKTPKAPVPKVKNVKPKIFKPTTTKLKNGPKYALHKMVPQNLLVESTRLAVLRPTQAFHPISAALQERPVADPSEQEEKKFDKQLLSVINDVVKMGTGFAPLLPQRHFTCLLVARRESGKSNLINDLMKDGFITRRIHPQTNKVIVSAHQFFQQKILFSPTAGLDKSLDASSFDSIYRTKEDMERVIQAHVNNPRRKPTLFVGDDVQGWCSYEANSILSWFATVNRHYDASLLISVQNLKQGLSPTIRNNCSHFINFRIALESERRKMQEDIGADFMKHYDMIDWDVMFQYMVMVVTKGPTLWYFQGVTPQTIECKAKNVFSLLTPDHSTKWKLIGKG